MQGRESRALGSHGCTAYVTGRSQTDSEAEVPCTIYAAAETDEYRSALADDPMLEDARSFDEFAKGSSSSRVRAAC